MSRVSSNSPPQHGAVAAGALSVTPHATGDEAASYTSTVVQLPPTIPELIRCLEQKHERCAQLTRCLERVHSETRRLMAASTGASADDRYQALLTAAAVGAAQASSSPSGESAAALPPAPLSCAFPVRSAGATSSVPAVVVARGVVATAATESGASVTRAAGDSAVRGRTLVGKVVAATCATSPASAAVRAVVVTGEPSAMTLSAPPSAKAVEASAPTTATPSTAGSTALSAEDAAELRLRVVALEATQELLTCTRSELSAAHSTLDVERERLREALADLAELRREVLAEKAKASSPSLPQGDDAAVSVAHRIADMQARLAEREAEARAAGLRHEGAVYALTQLQEKLASITQENAFLKETNTHLEGQLQRLLMGAMETTATSAPSSTASAAATAGLTTREAYQKDALEKQISDLHAITDKLARDEKKQALRCAKAEAVVQALERENAELKASVLHYRRQVSESEMVLEHAVSRKEEDARIHQLERDANRLRSALRERTDQYQSEKADWEQQRITLSRRLRVHESATKQLLRRMLTHQVREVMSQQCVHAAAQRYQRHDSQGSAAVLDSSDGVPKAPVPTTTAASSSRVSPPSRDPTVGVVGLPLVASLPSSTPETGVAADTVTLVDRERQLEELKQTFERRVALVEAQYRAEAQQLLALNKELRHALAVSQEELSQKTRLLEAAQRRSSTFTAMPLSSFPARQPATTSLERSSLSGTQRDTATAWACRNDSEDGPAAVSLDDLDSSDALVSTHISILAPPRQITDIERRYNPEKMSTWEAVQVENEALLDRLTTMQEEKWKLTTAIEDLQRQCGALKGELRRNASTMNHLLAAGVVSPAAVARGSEEGQLRALQCLLQETLHAKIELEERLQEATRHLK
ncbi:hypothetical protein JKF63_04534 [Porcisia hertigi]|uniref:Uncharacterized protein n=1 Tax=Porcisia hertigi TaxID=2761500 RepID=A0A836HMY5_9TRYP|nr:hypothetical protein JKF63_04534 [Porcisia hertigi]